MRFKLTCSLVLGSLLVGCGVPQAEYNHATSTIDSLQSVVTTLTGQVTDLKAQVDELQNGEQRLLSSIESSIEKKNWIATELYINKLLSKHPESSKCAFYSKKLKDFEPLIAAERKAVEKARRDSIRMANIDDLGNWEIQYYVDDFGEKTKDGYITYSSRIRGTFSNSATQNSALEVRPLFEKFSKDFKLFEYAGNNPVKASHDEYSILVKDSQGNNYSLYGENSSDRISVEWKGLTSALLAGGVVKVRIKEKTKYGTPSEYSFEFNADHFDNALIKLYGIDVIEEIEKKLDKN